MPIKIIKKWVIAKEWVELIGLFVGMALLALSVDYFKAYWLVTPWIAAPLAATAFIVFFEPESRYAKPWAVMAGNVISGFVAISLMQFPDMGVWAVPVVVTTAAVLMALAGALHPPACAVALLIVVRHIDDYRFILFPIAYGALTLVLVALSFDWIVRKFDLPRMMSRNTSG